MSATQLVEAIDQLVRIAWEHKYFELRSQKKWREVIKFDAKIQHYCRKLRIDPPELDYEMRVDSPHFLPGKLPFTKLSWC